jgi:type IV pilus assembly protein PilN
MLTINLLPIRQLQQHARARNEIIGFAVLLAGFLSLLGIAGVIQASNAKALQTEIAQLKTTMQSYDKILAEIKKIEADKKELENRIGIIEKLKKDSSLTVHVLDDVARTVDNRRMWLTGLDQQGSSLSMNGVALDNKTIAEFMNGLEASPVIREVNLSDSSIKKVAGQDLKSFVLNCAVGDPVEQVETTKKATSKGAQKVQPKK